MKSALLLLLGTLLFCVVAGFKMYHVNAGDRAIDGNIIAIAGSDQLGYESADYRNGTDSGIATTYYPDGSKKICNFTYDFTETVCWGIGSVECTPSREECNRVETCTTVEA